MKRKIVGLLLSIVLVVGLMPTVGFAAADGTGNDDRAVQTQHADDGQEDAVASLCETYTVYLAIPKVYKASNALRYAQLVQDSSSTMMMDTNKEI